MLTFKRSKLVKDVITPPFFLLDYKHFNNYCKMIATDLSKQQTFDADTKGI